MQGTWPGAEEESRGEIPPRDLKRGKSGTIKASDLPPNCAGHRTKANGVALIKKDALDRRILSGHSTCDFFF